MSVYRIPSPPPQEPKKRNWDWGRIKLFGGSALMIAGVLFVANGALRDCRLNHEKEAAYKTRWETAPCASFRLDTIDHIPGRCLGWTWQQEGNKYTPIQCMQNLPGIQVPAGQVVIVQQ